MKETHRLRGDRQRKGKQTDSERQRDIQRGDRQMKEEADCKRQPHRQETDMERGRQ